MTPGDQKINSLFVEMVRIYRFVIEKISYIINSFSDFNVGSSKIYTIQDYIERLHCLRPSRSRLEFGALPCRINEIMVSNADIGKLQ